MPQPPKLATGEPTFAFPEGKKFGPCMARLSSSRQLLVGALVWGDYRSKDDAAVAAGYSGRRAARDAIIDPQVVAAINEELALYKATMGLRGLKTIDRLQDSAKSEKVKLEAAIKAAGLAGHVPKQEIEVKHTHTLDDLSTEELNARIREMHEKLYPRIEAPKVTDNGHLQMSPNDNIADAEFVEVDKAA